MSDIKPHRTLIHNLRTLAGFEHSDVSVADEAANEIERLRKALERIAYEFKDADLFQKIARNALFPK